MFALCLHVACNCSTFVYICTVQPKNLAVWQSTCIFATVKLQSTNIKFSYIHVAIPYQTTKIKFISISATVAQPPNLIPTNISGYTVYTTMFVLTTRPRNGDHAGPLFTI